MEPSTSERTAAPGAEGGPRTFRAPGRVNLMGDHTDYNDGWVLPMAVDLECRVETMLAPDAVTVRSGGFDGTVTVAADGSDDPAGVDPPWGRLVAGLVAALADRGRHPTGIDATVTTTVPVGSGLSSSAAFAVALGLALCDAAGLDLSSVDLARACAEAEERATGVPCGLMDQIASLSGVAGHALLVDCRAHTVLPVPMPADLAVLVVHSGSSRRLEDTPYSELRSAFADAAAAQGVSALRDLPPEPLPAEPLARHVVSENARASATAFALAADAHPTIARAFADSHRSLRDDVGCSTPELDALVDAMVGAGAVGARLTGAGWGGCAVAVVERDRLTEVRQAVGGHANWVVRPSAGAGLVAA